VKFRVLKPVVSEWIESEGSVEDAIQDHHANAPENFSHGIDGSTYRIGLHEEESHEGIREIMSLRLYETEEGQKLISTIYHTGIFRKGRPMDDWEREKRIQKICEELGTTRENLFARNPGEEKYRWSK
jgi:hypothetical protein